ncbi:plastocyanin/azurin family copper-binding protein [Natronosalvus rutilus]|uniref:Plastocyanin/azurin family copper-binding protein n=1 Tax=Natronosalvus rutilus TaxID=2953753 RepID=A0A9E7N9M6_9EURY|nr:plastocyanin/azurin family copper-binding protein [Natronosalvus rutilus]UTF52908.1 plastocyanin/azurin family copper-binding protein [Natronosalvus rutilus]
MSDPNTRRRFLRHLGAGSALTAALAGEVSGAVGNRFQDEGDGDGTEDEGEGEDDGDGDERDETDGEDDSSDDPAVTQVVAGPDGAWRFEPEDFDIGLGEAVEWTFASAGHNVSSLPGASDRNRNPPNAEPFASYEDDAHFSVAQEGSTFRHVFTTPGEYEYVCVPHENTMVGTVEVDACADETVVVAPDGNRRFEPDALEVGLGDTVEWQFEEEGHNVTAHPEASDNTSVPEGAEPFASYELLSGEGEDDRGGEDEAEGDEEDEGSEVDHEATREADETFAHAFETPGTYEYVCAIHDKEMVGTVEVLDEPDVTVTVAPDGDLAFDPASLSLEVGDVVRWTFEEEGHNVSAHPEASANASVPEGAEPFASYDLSSGADENGDGEGETDEIDHEATRESVDTYDHRFVAVGQYEYVCAIHDEEMVGAVEVERCSDGDDESNEETDD